MQYGTIDEKTARLAHDMMSMTDYKEGSATAEYRSMVDQAAALVEKQKQKVSPFYYEKLDALLERYTQRLAQWFNDHNRNGTRCPSILIAGGSNFNIRRKEKQISRDDTLWREYDEIQGILSRIKSIGTGPVDLADPHARELLIDQLQRLQAELADSKAINAYYRKHKTFVGCPCLSEEGAERLTAEFAETRAVCPWIDKPFPDYQLTSIRGKIKRIQANLDKLDKLESMQNQPAVEDCFTGGKIVRNAEENRLQILFDEIPDADIRSALKSHGFHWSPRHKAWQRQLTQNAEYDARKILGLCE